MGLPIRTRWRVTLWFNKCNRQEGNIFSRRDEEVKAPSRTEAIEAAFRERYPHGKVMAPPQGAKGKYFLAFAPNGLSKHYLLRAVSVAQVRAYLAKREQIRCRWVQPVTAVRLKPSAIPT